MTCCDCAETLELVLVSLPSFKRNTNAVVYIFQIREVGCHARLRHQFMTTPKATKVGQPSFLHRIVLTKVFAHKAQGFCYIRLQPGWPTTATIHYNHCRHQYMSHHGVLFCLAPVYATNIMHRHHDHHDHHHLCHHPGCRKPAACLRSACLLL